MNKIKKLKDLQKLVFKLKEKGRKIVSVSGSFDILHVGHIRNLKEAKKQGDILIVLLNSDKSIKLYKGPNRPINNQKHRAELLSAIEYVDYIATFDEINPINALRKIKPDVYCQGQDWGKNCIERKVIEENGGQIYVLPWVKGFSTSKLIKKIYKTEEFSAPKAIFLDRDGTINVNKPEYVHRVEDFKFKENAIKGLKELSKSEYKLFIITNQSGVARGYFSKDQLKKLNSWLLRRLSREGIEIEKIYYCPHHPDFTESCNCRKPQIGMLIRAVKEYGINLSKSWLIGDSEKDIIMARSANLKSIKIGKRVNRKLKLEPNYYAKDLLEASGIVLNNS